MTDPQDAIAQWYVLDADDRIIDLDPQWDQFALANGGESACARFVLGRTLTSFIGGDPTRMFLSAVFAGVRLTGQSRRLPYRCNSPSKQRQLEMLVLPQPGRQLRIEHRLLHVAPLRRDPVLLQSVRPFNHRLLLRCSQCQQLRLHGQRWIDPERLPPGPHTIVDTICPACAGHVGTDTAPAQALAAAMRQYSGSP